MALQSSGGNQPTNSFNTSDYPTSNPAQVFAGSIEGLEFDHWVIHNFIQKSCTLEYKI